MHFTEEWKHRAPCEGKGKESNARYDKHMEHSGESMEWRLW